MQEYKICSNIYFVMQAKGFEEGMLSAQFLSSLFSFSLHQ